MVPADPRPQPPNPNQDHAAKESPAFSAGLDSRFAAAGKSQQL
jgi:hypothetical protein